MALRLISKKPIKNLSELLADNTYFLPKELANDWNDLGKPIVTVCVNGERTEIPVEENTTISHKNYCDLLDAGIITRDKTYDTKEAFNPIP